MRMALQQPSRVRGLVIVGSRADPYDSYDRIGYEAVIMDGWIQGDNPLEHVAVPIASSTIRPDPEPRRYWLDKWLTAGTSGRRHPGLAGRALIDRKGIEDQLADITAPVLVMHGIHDPVYDRAHQEALATRFGGPARVETTDAPRAFHTPTLTAPELTDPLLRQFLDGLPA